MYLLDHRVRLNVAAYMMNRENTQTDFDNVDTNSLSPTFNLHTEETRNANGVSKIKGLEAELTVKPTDSITFGASYAYTDIKIPNTPNPFLGNVLTPVFVVYTPKNSASGYIDYAIPVGDLTVNLHLDANYADAQYSFQSESVKTDSSFIMNGNVALTDFAVADSGTRANLSFWIRNLLDETHIYRRSEANAGTLGDYGNLNPPRTFGVELTVKY
jgi:iron complex outermembrane receptor protein